ncbi:hypothetical protein [Soonwooa sp.]|uniref:hypothetical protein n=1 Tax=Soonwooa sp. TaxID=1938592 RepID=UPI0028AA3AC7|nr:hypothetical protein [Soonwooa sp.]
MKLREEIREMLMQPKFFGLLISKFDKPHTTVKRWLDTDYKDLRLPENVVILEEVSGLKREEIFQEEDKREVYDVI